MRDLKAHPPTVAEIIDNLNSCSAQFEAEQAAGDMRPTLLILAALIVAAAPKELKQKILDQFGRQQ